MPLAPASAGAFFAFSAHTALAKSNLTLHNNNMMKGRTGRPGEPRSSIMTARAVNLSAGTQNYTVSRQWMSRPDDQKFLSLADLLAHTKAGFEGSTAEIIEGKAVRAVAPVPESMADTQVLNLDVAGNLTAPTHWSFGQTASLIKAPAGYLRNLPSQIAADCINWGLRNHRTEMLKTYRRIDGSMELRAVTGPDYGRIPDYEVVQAVMDFAGDGTGADGNHWKVPGTMDWGSMRYDPNTPVTKATTTLFASDRDVFLFLVDDLHPIEVGKLANGDPDLMFRGFYVWNSEVGAKTAGIAAFYLRAICCNRILWGVENFQEISIRHTKNAPDKFMAEAMPALESYSDGSVADLMAGVQAAKDAVVAKDEEDALAWLRSEGLNKRQAQAVWDTHIEEEGRAPSSVWDFAQGVTAMARDIPTQDARIDLEKVAGKWLDKAAA